MKEFQLYRICQQLLVNECSNVDLAGIVFETNDLEKGHCVHVYENDVLICIVARDIAKVLEGNFQNITPNGCKLALLHETNENNSSLEEMRHFVALQWKYDMVAFRSYSAVMSATWLLSSLEIFCKSREEP